MVEQSAKDTAVSLAVLPLQSFSEDATLDMLATGLLLDVITDLSRFRALDILAYNSVQNLPEGQELPDVDYIVKGLLRSQQDDILINLQLVHARQNRLVWAEKFKAPRQGLLQLEADIVEKIAVSLQRFVDYDLINEIRKKPLTSLNAYESWLRGFEEIKAGTLEADEQARHYFRNAMQLDPHYARAYTGMSLSYFNEWSCQLWSRWDLSRKGAFEWAQKAVELDEFDHVSTAILGRIYLFQGEYEKAEHYLRKALQLNPNDTENLILIASSMAFLGYPEEGLALYERARRLDPAAENAGFACGAFVHFELGDFDKTIELGRRHPLGKGWVDFPAFLAAAYFRKGDLANMQACWQEFLEQFSQKINNGRPADTPTALRWMMDVNPYRGPSQIRPFWEYLLQHPLPENAGLPAATASGKSVGANRIENAAGVWTFEFAGKQVVLPERKGFQDLARLLDQPNRPIHCTELMGAAVLESGASVFDEKARKAYQARLRELQQELEEAGLRSDSGRVEALQQEYDQLLDHLSGALGLGGKTRKVAGSVEKARAAITWRIRSAIRRIAEVHPPLGKHLETAVRTGVFCTYAPEITPDWNVVF